MPVNEVKQTQEEVFRDGLEAVIAVGEALAEHCNSTQELLTVVRLALESDGQLSLLMSLVRNGQKK